MELPDSDLSCTVMRELKHSYVFTETLLKIEYYFQGIRCFFASNIVNAHLSFKSAVLFAQCSIPLGVVSLAVRMPSDGYCRQLFVRVSVIASYNIFNIEVVFFNFVFLDISNNQSRRWPCVF